MQDFLAGYEEADWDETQCTAIEFLDDVVAELRADKIEDVDVLRLYLLQTIEGETVRTHLAECGLRE